MDLPYEIWLQIVQFLPGSFVRTLLTVNRALFEIAMDERYREVQIMVLDERTLWIIFRLRDPSVASRVRSLRINPYIENGAVVRNLWLKQRQTSPKRWVRKVVERALRIRSPASSKEIFMSFDEVIGMIDAVLPALSRVSEFVLEDYFQRSSCDMRSLYTTAWAGFGSNLRNLTFKMGMEIFLYVLQDPSLHFPQLQEFGIAFVYTPAGMDMSGDTIRNLVVPFIDRHESTIRALSFSSQYSMDFSTLFISLGLFPILQQITLEFPFNDPVWSSNSGFTLFLRNHTKTLRHIKFSEKYHCFPRFIALPCYRAWVIENAADKAIFCGLESITIPTVEEADFDSVLLTIQNSIGNLTKLALTGRYLFYREIRALVEMLSSHPLHENLRILQLNVLHLIPSVVQLFIESFPQLKELNLYAHLPFLPTDEQRFSQIKSISVTCTIAGSSIHVTL